MTDEDDTTTKTDRSDRDSIETNRDGDALASAADSHSAADGGTLDVDSGRSPGTYLYWGAFAVLLLLGLVAVVRFYMSASQAISIWIAPDYEPIFQSAFNLAVLFACALGLSVLVRRMRD